MAAVLLMQRGWPSPPLIKPGSLLASFLLRYRIAPAQRRKCRDSATLLLGPPDKGIRGEESLGDLRVVTEPSFRARALQRAPRSPGCPTRYADTWSALCQLRTLPRAAIVASASIIRCRPATSGLWSVALAFALARRWPHVLSNAVDPGWTRTRMGGPGAPVGLDTGQRTQTWLL